MATITTAGRDIEVLNITTSTTPKPISFSQAVNSFVLQARTAVDLNFYPKNETGGYSANYFTVKSGQSLTLDVAGQAQETVVGWVASTSSTPVCEVIGVY